MKLTQSQLQYFDLYLCLQRRYTMLDDSDDEDPTESHVRIGEKMYKTRLECKKVVDYILKNYSICTDFEYDIRNIECLDNDGWRTYIYGKDDYEKEYFKLTSIDILRTGEIGEISNLITKDTTPIQKGCVSLPFPIKSDFDLRYDIENRVVMCGDNVVTVVNLSRSSSQYTPLYCGVEDDDKNNTPPLCGYTLDRYIRMPYYDKGSFKAFIGVRFYNGMNIAEIRFDTSTNTAFILSHFNADYPEGIALKLVDETTVYMYENRNDLQCVSLYKNPEYIPEPHRYCNTILESECWIDLNIDFKRRDHYIDTTSTNRRRVIMDN